MAIGLQYAAGSVSNIGQQINNINFNRPSSERLRSTSRTHWRKLTKRYGSEDSWLFPLPGEEGLKFEPEKYYVGLAMDILNRGGDESLVEGESCQLSDLFRPASEREDRPLQVLIRADAGFGKSTLCTKLAYDWAKDVQTFPCFPCESTLVLKYRLRDLKEGDDLEQKLVEFLKHYAQRKGTSIQETKEIIEEYGDRLLLVLDGLDEVSMTHRNQVHKILQTTDMNHQSVFGSASIIVTSRLIEMGFSFLSLFDKHFRITGLTEASKKELIRNFFNNEERKISAFNEMVKSNKMNHNAFSPLLTILMCFSFSEGVLNVPENEFELFTNCVKLMLKRCNVRDNLHYDDSCIETILLSLGRCFLKSERNCITVISSGFLRKELGEHYTLAVMSGILKSVPQRKRISEEMLEVVHKRFHEHLVDGYLKVTWSGLCSDTARKEFLTNHMPIFDRLDIYVKKHLITVWFRGNQALRYILKYNITDGCSSLRANISFKRQEISPLSSCTRLYLDLSGKPLWFELLSDLLANVLGIEKHFDNLNALGSFLNSEYSSRFVEFIMYDFDITRDLSEESSEMNLNPFSRNLVHGLSFLECLDEKKLPIPARVDLNVWDPQFLSVQALNGYLRGIVSVLSHGDHEMSQISSVNESFNTWISILTVLFSREHRCSIDIIFKGKGFQLRWSSRIGSSECSGVIDWTKCSQLLVYFNDVL